MKEKLKHEVFLYLFATLLIVMFYGLPFAEFFLLTPLFFYLQISKKINWIKTIILIAIASIIDFIYFYGYGIKFLIVTIIAHLLVFLPFMYISKKLMEKKYSIISIPSAFYIIFFIMHFTVINNFWINLTGFMSFFPEIIRFVGSFGVVFLLVMFNYALYQIIQNSVIRNQVNFKYLPTIIILGLLLLTPVGFFDSKNKEYETLSVVGIQGNVNQNWGDRSDKYKENFKKYEAITNEAKRYKPDIIIWPEYTFTYPIEFDFEFLQQLNQISLDNNATLIVGSIKLENSTSDNSKRYNTLYIFENNYLNMYHAYEPVTIFDKEVVKAKNNTKIPIKNKNIGLALCYEENFPYIFNNQNILGAQAFFTIGNQYYINHKQGLVLTSYNSKLRAAETNKYVFRLETAGLSIVINNKGNVIKELPINTEGILHYEIPLKNEITFYSKYYQYIEWGLFFISIIIITLSFTIKNKEKTNQKKVKRNKK